MASSHKKGSLPLYFRKKPKGKTANGHKMGRRWSQKGAR